VKTLMSTPAPTQNAVAANHIRDHLASTTQRYLSLFRPMLI
jgi:hypothetical protein